jgi:UDP-glucose 4-epimerase
MKKVLITGSSGFLAHHIIPVFLDSGYDVIGIDKRYPPKGHSATNLLANRFINADVMDLGFRDLMGVDYVIHLAFATNIPNSVRHPKETTFQNIDMTIHLLEVCKDAGVKKVFFPSTASLYGHNPTPWKEDMPTMPIEPYSWQKLACEEACQMYSRAYGVPTVIGRFFQVFGELQRDDTALAAFLKLKKAGKPITLTETTAQSTFKSGQRDFIYAGDVAEAVLALVESDKTGEGEVFNVSFGDVRTMEQVAKAIGGEVKWIPKREYEVEKHLGDISKIKSVTKWEPKVKVIDWLMEHA